MLTSRCLLSGKRIIRAHLLKKTCLIHIENIAIIIFFEMLTYILQLSLYDYIINGTDLAMSSLFTDLMSIFEAI